MRSCLHESGRESQCQAKASSPRAPIGILPLLATTLNHTPAFVHSYLRFVEKTPQFAEGLSRHHRNRAMDAGCPTQSSIGCEQIATQELCQRHVGSVVGREAAAEFPDAIQE